MPVEGNDDLQTLICVLVARPTGVGSRAPYHEEPLFSFSCFLLLCCTFSLFLLLTAQHTIYYVTRLLPARSLQYIKVES